MRRQYLHLPDDSGNRIAVGGLLIRAVFPLPLKIPVGGILQGLFVRQVDQRTNQREGAVEHLQTGRHTGYGPIKHHAHQKAFHRVVAVVS